MKTKKYTHGVTFFIDLEMYEYLKKISDEKQVSLSEFLRGIIDRYIINDGKVD
jgi:predicted CopG family antitoxin